MLDILTIDVAISMPSNGVDLLFHVTPSTGGEIDKKYVNIDLHLSLPPEVCGES